MDEKAATLLFNEMVSLFITVRGFAFTTSYVEIYKQTQNKNLQKKKAIRKELN